MDKSTKPRRNHKKETKEELFHILLIEGYKARNEEGAELNAEMEFATLEDWPD